MKKTLYLMLMIVALVFPATAAGAELSAQRQQEILQNVLSIYDPQQFLAEGGVSTFQKCGTSALVEAHWSWPRLSEETRARLSQYLEERPELQTTYDTPDGHFRIHYDTTGSDSVNLSLGVDTNGVPVYVTTCAGILHNVWEKETGEMGYPAPPPDSFYAKGGTAAYDVYLENKGPNYLGLTQPDVLVPGTVIPIATSFLIMDNDYRGYKGYNPDQWDEMMSVTAAHEFFHAVQFGIDYSEYFETYEDGQNGEADIWWHEMTATWMEDAVYDDVNDYRNYLPTFFLHPNWALTTQGSGLDPKSFYPYAAVVWPIFLSEHFAPQIIHDIWMQCGRKMYLNSIEAFVDQIAARGSTFHEELGRFRLWCYYSGDRHEQFSFSEGERFPTISETDFLTTHSEFPVTATISPLKRPEYLGVAYLEFNTPPMDSAIDFKLQLIAKNLDLWAVGAAGISPISAPEVVSIRDITNVLVVPMWRNFTRVMAMVMPYSENYSNYKDIAGQVFSYEVSDTLRPVAEDEILPIYPNPFFVGAGTLSIPVHRKSLEETEVFLYTASGDFVRGGRGEKLGDKRPFYVPAGEGQQSWPFEWDGLNREGEKVASGVYLCLVRLGDRKSVQKVAVFNK